MEWIKSLYGIYARYGKNTNETSTDQAQGNGENLFQLVEETPSVQVVESTEIAVVKETTPKSKGAKSEFEVEEVENNQPAQDVEEQGSSQSHSIVISGGKPGFEEHPQDENEDAESSVKDKSDLDFIDIDIEDTVTEGPLKTKNELDEDQLVTDVSLPNEVPSDHQIYEMGNIWYHREPDRFLVQPKEAQNDLNRVLLVEEGSLVCLKDRIVIGTNITTLGPVVQPIYDNRFATHLKSKMSSQPREETSGTNGTVNISLSSQTPNQMWSSTVEKEQEFEEQINAPSPPNTEPTLRAQVNGVQDNQDGFEIEFDHSLTQNNDYVSELLTTEAQLEGTGSNSGFNNQTKDVYSSEAPANFKCEEYLRLLCERYPTGLPVFFSSKNTPETVAQFKARQPKGSDASNLHDEPVPQKDQEFSDDEAEAQAKAERRKSRALNVEANDENIEVGRRTKSRNIARRGRSRTGPSTDAGSRFKRGRPRDEDDKDSVGENEFERALKSYKNLS